MNPFWLLIGAVWLLLTIYTFILFAIDKRRAIKQQTRIPEKRLLKWAAFGGWMGAWCAIYFFRHKNQKWWFMLALVVITFLHLMVYSWLWYIWVFGPTSSW
jgi:uncharacterized membrane protein YsdA (DUF1294 family)